MAKSSNPKRKNVPKTVLKLPDLELSKSAVLNSLVSSSSQRSYDMRFVSSSNGIALNHDWRSTKRS
jgi:hypothetical protein